MENVRIEQLEAELRVLRARLAETTSSQLLVQACPDVILLVRVDGTVIDANETALSWLAVTREQLVGDVVYKFFPPETAGGRRRMVEHAIRTRARVRVIDESDSRVTDNLLVPLFDEQGEVDRLAIYARDITERQRAERQLRDQQKRRHHAEKMEALGRLAAGVAHDFNNLLTPIVSYLQLARQATPGAELLETAAQSAERASALIARILRYGNPEDGKRETLDLAELCSEAVALATSAFQGRSGLQLEVADNLPVVRGDGTQIHQALMNLCVNAAQAVERQHGQVWVRVRPAGPPRGGVVIRVEDDGPGVPEAFAGRIFDPFFSTRQDHAGSGIGLFIAQGVARSHQGTLTLLAQPDAGASFELWLPAGRTITAPPQVQRPVLKAIAKSKQSRHILALDDERAVLQVVELALTMSGHRVTCHLTAQAAVSAFQANPTDFDVAILDQNLTDGSGIDVARELRRVNPDVAILLVSGRATEELRREAHTLNVRTLPKPFSIESLQSALEDV